MNPSGGGQEPQGGSFGNLSSSAPAPTVGSSGLPGTYLGGPPGGAPAEDAWAPNMSWTELKPLKSSPLDGDPRASGQIPAHLMVPPAGDYIGGRDHVVYGPPFTAPSYDKTLEREKRKGVEYIRRRPDRLIYGLRPSILPRDEPSNPSVYARRFGLFPRRHDGRSLMSPRELPPDPIRNTGLAERDISMLNILQTGAAGERFWEEFQATQTREFELSWQRIRLGGLTMSEVENHGIWNHWDNDVQVDLPPEIHPWLTRDKWEDTTLRGFDEHNPKILYNLAGRRGLWDARNDDLVWNALLPILQMATQFLKPDQMPPIYNSLLTIYTLDKLPDGEVDLRRAPHRSRWLPVLRRRVLPEAEMLPPLRAMYQARIPLRRYVEETLQKRLHFMLRCDRMWQDGPSRGRTGSTTVQVAGSPADHKITIRLSVEELWPLLHPGFTKAEKAAAAFLTANTLLHELAHAMWFATIIVFGSSDTNHLFPDPYLQQLAKEIVTQVVSMDGQEPFFEEMQWSELGIAFEGETFGGETIPLWVIAGGVKHFIGEGAIYFPLSQITYPTMPLINQMGPNVPRVGYVKPRSRFAAAVPYKWATRFFRRDLYDVARKKFGNLVYKANNEQPFVPIGSSTFPNAFADLPGLLSEQWSRAILIALSNGNYWATYNWLIMIMWERHMYQIIDRSWLLQAANWPQGFKSVKDSHHGVDGIKSCFEHLRALLKLSVYLSLPEQSRFQEWWSYGKALPIPRHPNDQSIYRRDFQVYENAVMERFRQVTLAQQLLLGETQRYFSSLYDVFVVIMTEYLKLQSWQKQMLHNGQGNLPPSVPPNTTNRGTKFWTEMMDRSYQTLGNLIYLYGKIDMHIPEIASFFDQGKLPRLLEQTGLCAEAMSPGNTSRYPDCTYKLNNAVWLEQNLPELPSVFRRDRSDMWRPLAIYEMKFMEPDAKAKLKWFFRVNATLLPDYVMKLVDETDPDSNLSEMLKSASSGLGRSWEAAGEGGVTKKSIFDLRDMRIHSPHSEQHGEATGADEGAESIMQACKEASGSFPFTAQDAEWERQFQEYQPDPDASPDPMDPKTMKEVVSEAAAAESQADQSTAPHPDTLLPVMEDDAAFVKEVQDTIRSIFRPPPGARADDQWIRDILESQYKPDEMQARPGDWLCDLNSTYDNLFTSDQTPPVPPALRGTLPAQPSALVVPQRHNFQMERQKRESLQKSMLQTQQALSGSAAGGFAKYGSQPLPFADEGSPQLTDEQFQAMLTANRDKLPRESRHLGFDHVMAGYATRVRFESGEKRGRADWGGTPWDTQPFPDATSAESTIWSDVARLGVDAHDRIDNFLTNPRDLAARPWRMNRIRAEERDRGDGDWSTERYLQRKDLLGVATTTDPVTQKSFFEKHFLLPHQPGNVKDYRTPRDECAVVEGEEYEELDQATGLSRRRFGGDRGGRRRSKSPARF